MTASADTLAIERAIQAWVVAGSGILGPQVTWSDQGGGAPGSPYISLALIGDDEVGTAELLSRDAADPQPGAEIEHVVRDSRTATLSITCFQTRDGSVGPRRALAILADIRAARHLPDIADALRDAGVGVARFSRARSVGANINAATFQPRCVMEVTINLRGELAAPATYIQAVDITDAENEVSRVPQPTDGVGTAAGTSTAAGVSG